MKQHCIHSSPTASMSLDQEPDLALKTHIHVYTIQCIHRVYTLSAYFQHYYDGTVVALVVIHM